MGSERGARGVRVVTDDINQQESNGIWPRSAAVAADSSYGQIPLHTLWSDSKGINSPNHTLLEAILSCYDRVVAMPTFVRPWSRT